MRLYLNDVELASTRKAIRDIELVLSETSRKLVDSSVGTTIERLEAIERRASDLANDLQRIER